MIPLNPPDTVPNPGPATIDGSAPRQYYPQENGKFKLEKVLSTVSQFIKFMSDSQQYPSNLSLDFFCVFLLQDKK